MIYGISLYNFEFKSNLIVGICFLSSDLGKLPSSKWEISRFGAEKAGSYGLMPQLVSVWLTIEIDWVFDLTPLHNTVIEILKFHGHKISCLLHSIIKIGLKTQK